MAYFDIQPYASTNPAVGQLFGAEFAQRAAQRQADQQAAANALAGQQIAAQSRLAQAQLQAAQSDREYNRLFKEREFQAKEEGDKIKEGQTDRQLGIMDAAQKASAASSHVATDAERRAALIIDANSANQIAAQNANAMYQQNVNAEIDRQITDAGSIWSPLHTTAATTARLNDPTHPDRIAINKAAGVKTLRDMGADKSQPLRQLTWDPATFTFKPVQYDETGKAIVAPVAAQPSAGIGTGAAAGLGTGNLPVPVTANPAALGPMSPEAQAVTAVGQPLVNRVLSSAADMFGIKAPGANPAALGAVPAAQPSVRRTFGNSTVLITPEDDATLARQLVTVPPEQRPAVYRAMIDQWRQAGRAIVVTPPAAPAAPADALPDYNAYQ